MFGGRCGSGRLCFNRNSRYKYYRANGGACLIRSTLNKIFGNNVKSLPAGSAMSGSGIDIEQKKGGKKPIIKDPNFFMKAPSGKTLASEVKPQRGKKQEGGGFATGGGLYA